MSLVPSEPQRVFLEQACATYEQAMTPEAAQYLMGRRISKESAHHFRLGYVAQALPGHEQYHGRLAIPYITPAGVTSIRFRLIGDSDAPKYLGLPGDDLRIFNSRTLLDPRPYICICEGELDAITAHQAGLPAIGIPGVAGWREYYSRVFQGYSAVHILADNDDKGQGAEFAERVGAQVENARIHLMPEGHDVNSFVVAEGVTALLNRLDIHIEL